MLVAVVIHCAAVVEHSMQESVTARQLLHLTSLASTGTLIATPSLDATCRGMLMLHTACSTPVSSIAVLQ